MNFDFTPYSFAVGENTFPNAVAFTTGQRGFKEACGNESTAFPLDNCSFIWKDFSRSGWLTSLIEDVPYLATFNYLKVGFVLPPVDFYFRPFMLGLYKVLQRKVGTSRFSIKRSSITFLPKALTVLRCI
jgi:hypothetical protein